MDALETAGIKKFPQSHFGGFMILFTNKFQAGTRTVANRHLLVTVLYLLLCSFSLFIFKNTGFLFKVKIIPASIYVVLQKAVKDQSSASWYLGVAQWYPGRWCIKEMLLAWLFFFSLSAVPPWSLNREFFSVCGCSRFYFYKETRKIHSFPVTFFFFTAVLAARACTRWRGMPEGESQWQGGWAPSSLGSGVYSL